MAPGQLADLLVVDGDPLADVRVLADDARRWLVLLSGRPVAGRALALDDPSLEVLVGELDWQDRTRDRRRTRIRAGRGAAVRRTRAPMSRSPISVRWQAPRRIPWPAASSWTPPSRSSGASAAEPSRIEADVTSAADCERMAAEAIAALGHIDILVANAGGATLARAWEISEAEWDFVHGVCLKGVWLTTKYVVPHMIERKQRARSS